MDARMRISLGALLAAATVLPALAVPDSHRADRMVMPSSVVHTGTSTYDDQQLAADLVAAISADRAMNGATITAVVKDGRITLSGSAKDLAQAARAERIARAISARPVTAQIDIQGG